MMLLYTKPLIKKTLKSNNLIRRFCFYIITMKYFETCMQICISLNTILLMMKWYSMPSDIKHIISYINYTFAVIFTLEAALKIIGFGKHYFKDSWNIFDFTVVILTIVGIILQTTLSILGSQTSILRALRILRILRLIKRAKVLRMIVRTLLITIPSMANIGSLLLLVYYIYAVLGVQLFATLKL